MCSLRKSQTPVLTPCPAYLISWPAILARNPIRTSDALRALPSYHTPGPWQPLQSLEVHKNLVKASQEDIETVVTEELCHSPEFLSDLMPQPCQAFPLGPGKTETRH